MSRLLSSVRFTSFLAYSPHGPDEDPAARSSRKFVRALKNQGLYLGQPAIQLAVRRLVEESPGPIMDIFGSRTLLVPVPGSSPVPDAQQLAIPLRGRRQDFLWPARMLCTSLAAEGLSQGWDELLRRDQVVPRSSQSLPDQRARPARHFETISCSQARRRFGIERLVLVDDIITRGATLLGAASRLNEAFPDTEIVGFALVRTVSDPDDFRQILDPVPGTVSLRPAGDTLRRP